MQDVFGYYGLGVLGSGSVTAAGQRIKALKPVGALSSERGSSVASKIGRKLLPQKMASRVLGTKVLGAAAGRAIPYVGWAGLVVDAGSLALIAYYDSRAAWDSLPPKSLPPKR